MGIATPVAGRWDERHAGVPDAQPYGLSDSYRIGAEWLADCARVEDWGCGLGWLRTLIGPERYWGVDGSHSEFADAIEDLTEYRSETEGLFMRHVLEHNWEWEAILRNAAASYTKRMALILFTPMDVHTHNIEDDVLGVPNLSFRESDLTHLFGSGIYRRLVVTSDLQYGDETIYLLERP